MSCPATPGDANSRRSEHAQNRSWTDRDPVAISQVPRDDVVDPPALRTVPISLHDNLWWEQARHADGSVHIRPPYTVANISAADVHTGSRSLAHNNRPDHGSLRCRSKVSSERIGTIEKRCEENQKNNSGILHDGAPPEAGLELQQLRQRLVPQSPTLTGQGCAAAMRSMPDCASWRD